MDRLIVVIVSWNTKDLTRDCLLSLSRELDDANISSEVWVIDNCSADGSVQMIKEEFPQVTLIENSENVGFARANNQALREAKGSFYLLLNSDTVIPRDAIRQQLGFVRKRPEVAALGPRLVHRDGKIQRSYWPLPSLLGELRYCLVYHFHPFGALFSALFSLRRKDWNSISQPVEVQALSAACLLIRREVIDTIGVLAEDYFLFSEENDYFCRMRRAGFKSYYLPEAEVIHLVGQSRKKRAGFDSDVNFLRSRLIYFQKFHRRTLGVLRAVYRFFLGWSLGMARLSYAVKGRRDDYHIELYRHLRQTLGETDR